MGSHFQALHGRLAEEIEALSAALVIFAISNAYRTDVCKLLQECGFERKDVGFRDQRTLLYTSRTGKAALITKHPQGWPRPERDLVLKVARALLGARAEGAPRLRE